MLFSGWFTAPLWGECFAVQIIPVLHTLHAQVTIPPSQPAEHSSAGMYILPFIAGCTVSCIGLSYAGLVLYALIRHWTDAPSAAFNHPLTNPRWDSTRDATTSLYKDLWTNRTGRAFLMGVFFFQNTNFHIPTEFPLQLLCFTFLHSPFPLIYPSQFPASQTNHAWPLVLLAAYRLLALLASSL